MQRLFFSLKFTPQQQQQLLRYQQHALRAFPDSKAVATDNLHLTLFFLGQVTEQQKARLINAAAQLQQTAFSLTLDYLALFTKSRVVYLAPSVIPPALTSLQNQLTTICAAEGFTALHERYRPHITLLRHAKAKLCAEDHELTEYYEQVSPLQLDIERFALYHSTQSGERLCYLPMADFLLNKSGQNISP